MTLLASVAMSRSGGAATRIIFLREVQSAGRTGTLRVSMPFQRSFPRRSSLFPRRTRARAPRARTPGVQVIDVEALALLVEPAESAASVWSTVTCVGGAKTGQPAPTSAKATPPAQG